MEGEREKALRFALLADVHFRTEDPGRARKDEADLRRCAETFNAAGAAFLLQLGDLISGSEGRAPEELRRSLRALGAFGGRIRHLIGNHCLEGIPCEKLLMAYGLSRSYYAFTQGGVRFIALDTMEASLLRSPESGEDRKTLLSLCREEECKPWCGAVGSGQQAWLQEELRLAEERGTPVLMLSHLPLHPGTTDERHGILWNHRQIRAVLAGSPAVKACIGGHFHPGGTAEEAGIGYLTLPAFSTRESRPDGGCFTGEISRGKLAIYGADGALLYETGLE
ncbi:metallophosphoesterase [Chlorobium sp. N1]|uniref:metallophosphoesterase n=1 Tax=Chlorobium sp. N1 TaxID=2491138 RepID=UPI00103E1B4B|nr:metallophosphoesterase [Chlorobium sp. N1]TCD48103.1 metallophosphoesterase [Chlorobium sp. N1]